MRNNFQFVLYLNLSLLYLYYAITYDVIRAWLTLSCLPLSVTSHNLGVRPVVVTATYQPVPIHPYLYQWYIAMYHSFHTIVWHTLNTCPIRGHWWWHTKVMRNWLMTAWPVAIKAMMKRSPNSLEVIFLFSGKTCKKSSEHLFPISIICGNSSIKLFTPLSLWHILVQKPWIKGRKNFRRSCWPLM